MNIVLIELQNFFILLNKNCTHLELPLSPSLWPLATTILLSVSKFDHFRYRI